MHALVIFIATFAISAAVNMQARNAILGHYIALFLTSVFIGSVNLYLLTTLPHITNTMHGLAYIIGGAAGAVFGVIMHKRINRN